MEPMDPRARGLVRGCADRLPVERGCRRLSRDAGANGDVYVLPL